MIIHLIISILIIYITIKIIKSIEIREYYRDDWKSYNLKLWHVIIIIIIGVLPLVNIIIFIVFFIYFTLLHYDNPHIKLKDTSFIYKIIKFLNKSV